MNAAPATPPKEIPAIHAPAPGPREDFGYFSARAGFGVGGGSEGPAATYFASTELWPVALVGIGADASRAATTAVRILGPKSSDYIEAFRGKLSLRLPLRKGGKSVWMTPFLMGSLGLGPALVTTVRGYEPDPLETDPSEDYPSEDGCWFCYDYENRTRSNSELGVLLEGGVFVRARMFEFGAALRVDFAGETTIVTLAPSAGFEF